MTATRHYHAPDGTFRKVLAAHQVHRELAGWRAVAGLLPVPRLLGVRETGDEREIVYEDVFASGRCTALLADLINGADRDPAQIPTVHALVSQVCDSLLAAAQATRATRRLDECVPDLHLTRLVPGGRLDRWYTHGRPAWTLGGQMLSASDLACRTLVANGRELGSAWPAQMSGLHALACLAKLAELTHPAWDLGGWCALAPIAFPPARLPAPRPAVASAVAPEEPAEGAA
jgi:hypothetical protein